MKTSLISSKGLMTEEYKKLCKSRSIYKKGFPTGATLDDIKERLEDKSQAQNIQIQKHYTKHLRDQYLQYLIVLNLLNSLQRHLPKSMKIHTF